MIKHTAVGVAALAASLLLAVPPQAASAAEAAQTYSTHAYITQYGWPDNSGETEEVHGGNLIAYPVIHSSAGGRGTYSNPRTFASDEREFPVGTRIYVPAFHLYYIMEDQCVECESDWSGGKRHIDLWIGGNGTDDDAVLACEDKWTRDSGRILVNPPAGLPVGPPLYARWRGGCL
ncbi:hypothetical protein [Raineyella fluvialis]|uniref:3D domain-containing protein n=1 Tax=Raineyella fluvialis TaxID=2662261 RepID=A0A5Q2FBN7_9ACTN|nr:hypothetical protein [Raineyella fluvialis]QGF23137.1 hypothetical protein Rai3103_05065 [Raineyella fluvialis]